MVRLVLLQSARPIGLGLALGLLGAAAGARLLRAILAGLSPLDPVTYLGVALLLAVVALLATWSPARWRATGAAKTGACNSCSPGSTAAYAYA